MSIRTALIAVAGAAVAATWVVPSSALALQEQEQSALSRFLGEGANQSLQLLLNNPEDTTLTPEQARALPYAANYVRIGDGPRGLLVLGENDNISHNGQILGLKQQWFSTANEVLETYNARVQSLQNLNHPQVKQLWIARESHNGKTTKYHVDVRVPSVYHTEHKPHFMTKRHSYNVASAQQQQANEQQQTQPLTLPNGRTLNVTQSIEFLSQQGVPVAINEYWHDPETGRIVQSKQWLGPELGYLEFTEVQPYNFGAGNMQNWAFTPVATNATNANNAKNGSDFKELTTTDGSDPLQYIEVRVVDATNHDAAHATNDDAPQQAQQQPRKYTGLFYANSRLNQAVTEYHRNGVQHPYYEPLTRLSSGKLQQQFEARKQGMATKLALLEQTYRHDGETELAQQASKLAIVFNHWPLKASYIHGMSLANARLDLAQNPVLNTAEAATSTSNIPHYQLHLAAAPIGLNTTKHVGLTPQNDAEYVYVIDAFGVITKVPMQHYNGNAAHRAIAEQPGAIVLHSIADTDLPKGFRDLNVQLAQFLQHWDWTYTPKSEGVAN